MSYKLLPLKFPNKFSLHYDACEECGPHGDVSDEVLNGRTYDLCEKGKTLAVEALYPSSDEQDKLRCSSPRLEALERVAEAARGVVRMWHEGWNATKLLAHVCVIERSLKALAALDREEKPK